MLADEQFGGELFDEGILKEKEDTMEFHVGGAIHRLHNLLCRDVNRIPHGALVDSLTGGSHGWILCWLRNNSEQALFQRDMEKVFKLRRSSATAILQTMERNELIRREAVASDARLKRLRITEKGEELCRMIHEDIVESERRLTDGLTEEELLTLQSIVQKLSANLERGLFAQEAASAAQELYDIPKGKEGNETI
jgi:DNA-binding MarR family transcriptional regulator